MFAGLLVFALSVIVIILMVLVLTRESNEEKNFIELCECFLKLHETLFEVKEALAKPELKEHPELYEQMLHAQEMLLFDIEVIERDIKLVSLMSRGSK